MPFYKKTDTEIITGNRIAGPGFELESDLHLTYTYPVDGWYWFDTFDLAVSFFATNLGVNIITNKQARLALFNNNLLDMVDAAVLSSPKNVQIEWQYSADIYRTSPLVQSLTAGFGWTSAYVDGLFTYAKTL